MCVASGPVPRIDVIDRKSLICSVVVLDTLITKWMIVDNSRLSLVFSYRGSYFCKKLFLRFFESNVLRFESRVLDCGNVGFDVLNSQCSCDSHCEKVLLTAQVCEVESGALHHAPRVQPDGSARPGALPEDRLASLQEVRFFAS